MRTSHLIPPASVIALALFSIGCGGPHLAGTWTGTSTSTVGDNPPVTANIIATLSQSGDAVNGSMTLGDGPVATIVGKVASNTALNPLVVTLVMSSCPGIYNGTADIDPSSEQISGRVIAVTANCGEVLIRFTVHQVTGN